MQICLGRSGPCVRCHWRRGHLPNRGQNMAAGFRADVGQFAIYSAGHMANQQTPAGHKGWHTVTVSRKYVSEANLKST